MGDRDVPFEPLEKCDLCGKEGAFDFMGDFYCQECAAKFISAEPCNRCGCNPCECDG